MRYKNFVVPVLIALQVASCASVRVTHEYRDAPTATAAQATGEVVVQPGQTLYAIASGHGVSVSDLATWNALTPPFTIHPGQRLRLMPPAVGAATVPVAGAVPVPASPPRASIDPVKPVKAPASAAKNTASTPKVSIGAPQGRWRWPADGELIGRRSAAAPGIDIAGTAGSPVRAVADGVVLYSSSGSPGYEELIVIRHEGGWVSAYAHNRKRLVAEGRHVKAGDQIAEMGRVGVARDQLHFELRHNGELVDPLKHLPSH